MSVYLEIPAISNPSQYHKLVDIYILLVSVFAVIVVRGGCGGGGVSFMPLFSLPQT